VEKLSFWLGFSTFWPSFSGFLASKMGSKIGQARQARQVIAAQREGDDNWPLGARQGEARSPRRSTLAKKATHLTRLAGQPANWRHQGRPSARFAASRAAREACQ